MGVGFATFPIVSGCPKYSDSTFFIKSFIFVNWKDPLPESVCGEKHFSNHQVVPLGSCTGNENIPNGRSPWSCRASALGPPTSLHL